MSRAGRRTTGLVSAGVELEDDAADLHVVAGLEARGLERLDHAERTQALFDVAERLLVVHVVAGDQALHALALHPERALAYALDPEGVAAAGAVDAVGGRRVRRGLVRALRRHALEDRPHQLFEALAGCRRGRDHLHVQTARPGLDHRTPQLARPEARLRQGEESRQGGEPVGMLAPFRL